MIRLYSRRRAEQAIERETPFIRETAEKYGVPVSWIKGILLQEMTELNLMDPLADLAVKFYYFRYHLSGRVQKSKGHFSERTTAPPAGDRFMPSVRLTR